MKELDCVKIVKLQEENRAFEGTENVRSSPRIGDIGTIVYLDKNFYIVESVDFEGYTIWLADFSSEELEIYER